MLGVFIAQFNEKCIGIEDLTVSSAIIALLRGTRDEYFKRFLSKNKPKIMTELRPG